MNIALVSSSLHSTVSMHACVCVCLDFETTGGVAYAELLGRSNLVAVVGGGQAPKFPDRNGVCVCGLCCVESIMLLFCRVI